MQLISLEKKITTDLPQSEAEILEGLLKRAEEKGKFQIEIGCGNGHFLAAYGKKHADAFFLGIEFKKGRCYKTLKKIDKNGLGNIEILHAKGEDVVDNLPPGCVDHYHIYFPDPWPKAKHKKRRFLRMTNLETMVKTLTPGGQIFFISDIYDYTLQTKILFSLHNELSILNLEPPEEAFISIFANRFNKLEKNFYFVAARKVEIT